MKLNSLRFRHSRCGYTLVELSLAMLTGIMIVVMLLALFNQQMAFLRIFKAQSFLTTEAPIINNYVTRVIGSAEGYNLYRDVDSLIAGADPVMQGASALVLRFKQPDGTFRASVLSFEGEGADQGLYYRRVTRDATISDRDWALSKVPHDVEFFVQDGVLRVRITGPNEEVITYSGSQQL